MTEFLNELRASVADYESKAGERYQSTLNAIKKRLKSEAERGATSTTFARGRSYGMTDSMAKELMDLGLSVEILVSEYRISWKEPEIKPETEQLPGS